MVAVVPEHLIDGEGELKDFVEKVRGADWVGVDTEADSLYSYPERLCLIQLGLPCGEYLVDPLCGLDLGPLAEAFGGHRLMLHGADYDLRLFYRSLRFVPAEVFDTMLAARLLGYKEFGLERLVARVLGVTLEKGPQKANWSRRPLTRRMAEYARNDAKYLKPLTDHLAEELEKSGRTSWHDAMCARLIRDSAREPEVDGDAVWRLSGAHRLSRRGLAVLRALWHWRDGEARRLCRPPYFVLSHEILVRVAEQASGGGSGWQRGLPMRMPEARRAGLVEAVSGALKLAESDWPHLLRSSGVRLTMQQRKSQQQIQDLRDAAAQRLGIDPSLIASRAMLVRLAGGQADLDRELMPWQRELLGV